MPQLMESIPECIVNIINCFWRFVIQQYAPGTRYSASLNRFLMILPPLCRPGLIKLQSAFWCIRSVWYQEYDFVGFGIGEIRSKLLWGLEEGHIRKTPTTPRPATPVIEHFKSGASAAKLYLLLATGLVCHWDCVVPHSATAGAGVGAIS